VTSPLGVSGRPGEPHGHVRRAEGGSGGEAVLRRADLRGRGVAAAEVPGRREVHTRSRAGGDAGGHYPAVITDGDAAGLIADAEKVRHHLAVVAERGVEATVGVVAHRRKVGVGPGVAGEPGRHDLAVGTNGDAVGLSSPLAPGPTGVITCPPEPKAVSGLPSALYRATAKSWPEPERKTTPATTALPSSCTATSSPLSLNALGKSVAALPSSSNPGSGSPAAARAAAAYPSASASSARSRVNPLTQLCCWSRCSSFSTSRTVLLDAL
jgi:hypothetical protein